MPGLHCGEQVARPRRSSHRCRGNRQNNEAEVEVQILDHLFEALPTPPFTDEEKQLAAKKVYQHIWQQSTSGAYDAQVAP